MRRLKASIPVLVMATLLTSGCAGSRNSPAAAAGDLPPPSASPLDPRIQLAGLVAAAKDRRFSAGYTFTPPGQAPRTVTVELAADGSWRVEVPGGALGGQATVALVGNATGLYQCRVSGASPSCVKAADPDGTLPPSADPRVQHPLVDWLDPLTDRTSALSVTVAPAPAGARGTCFSVEANTAALTAPVDPGVYCYDTDGTLTAVKAGFGSLVLASTPAPAPATVALPGPVTAGAPLPTAAAGAGSTP
ncbi:hypothetical protein ACNTMW_21300 [Planosporangium sp. 12N6]|uniref:hypothetical protein n=1 Tax=Planosporangium spinosum TaxID=3402278 RepID=UPI003CF7D6AC